MDKEWEETLGQEVCPRLVTDYGGVSKFCEKCRFAVLIVRRPIDEIIRNISEKWRFVIIGVGIKSGFEGFA